MDGSAVYLKNIFIIQASMDRSADISTIGHPKLLQTQWCRQQVTVVQLGQISGAKLEQTVITSYFQRWTTEVNQRQALPADPRNSTVE